MSARVVYKYSLHADLTRVELPVTSRPVFFGDQHNELMVWVDQPVESEQTETHEFLIRGTGHEYSAIGWRHIGSTMTASGLFVFHCFGRVAE